MNGNKAYLSNYEDFNGEPVSFGGGVNGKVTGKGVIKTGNLDFEPVYYVKELKYNLFSVSQICDKKNNVLFTEDMCFVLSKDYKIPDESQILLKIPRKGKLYSFDMYNIVANDGYTLDYKGYSG